MEIIEVEKGGVTYSAEYALNENVVTVFGVSGEESTQLGSLSEEHVARMLLKSLIRKGQIVNSPHKSRPLRYSICNGLRTAGVTVSH